MKIIILFVAMILGASRSESAVDRPTDAGPALPTLAPGACVDLTLIPPALGEEVGHVALTPLPTCDVAHDAEVIGVGHMLTPVDQALPRVADFEAFAAEICPPAFASHVGTRPPPGPALNWAITHGRVDATIGMYRVVCYVTRADGQPLRAPVREQR